MKSKVLAVILTLLLVTSVSSLAGCGGNKSTSPVDQKSSQQVNNQNQVSVDEASDSILAKGPHGETAVPADQLKLTDEEITKLKKGKYTAAIAMHYSGNDWAIQQTAGLKDTLLKYGIEVVAVTDAQFKPEKQVSDIETIIAKKPSILFSIPVDPDATATIFKKAADQGIKIVFMDNVPTGMQPGKDYVSVVSADNYGNGVAAADAMAEALNGKGKIGVIYHDANFYVTNQRRQGFEDRIKNKYPDIQIVASMGFQDPNKVESVASAMLTRYPNLNGIWANWDVPAEGVMAAARTAGRNDLVITTDDLGNNVALEMAKGGLIKGLGAQLPYDQGVAEATLAAYALLGKQAPPYVAVRALKVTRSNLLEAYKKVYHKDAPQEIQDALKK